MANTVDERIVEARFDSSDFEKGVDKTVKKLDELKQSLNLKDSGKSIAEFADETTKGVDKASSALERLSNRFTTFTGMIKQQLLSGLANEVSSAFLKIEQSAKRLITSLSSEQMRVGMQKYTDILTSVRTLVVGGEAEDVAYKEVDRLQIYSDQTNASLERMVGLMTKLKTSGAGIDDARKMVEGFGNAAFSMGVKVENLNNLFDNFAQAYGKGSMKLEDWKTFQSFNMVGTDFRNLILQAMEEEGTILKDAAGLYQANTKYGKEIKKSQKYAADQWENLLTSGVFNKKVMEKVFGQYYYFQDIEQEQLDMIEKMDDAQRKTFFEENGLSEFAYKSFKAGQEARSFADAINTLKNAISTGWKTSFELIFGKLDKATEFFTWLSDNNLVKAIRSIGDFRNEVLKAWGADYLDGGIFHAMDENGNFGTGRDKLLQALENIDEMIGIVHDAFVNMLPEGPFIAKWNKNLTFAQNIGYNLAIMTNNFKKATDSMVKFFTTEEEYEEDGEKKSRRVLKPEYVAVIQSVGKAFGSLAKGAGAALGIIGKLAGILGRTFARILTTVQPVLDAIGDAFNKLFEPIVNLNQNGDFFQNIENAIDNLLIVIEPIMGPLSAFIGLLGEIGSFFISIGIDTIATNIELLADVLGFVIELFGGTSAQKANEGVGVIEGWANDIKAFGETCKEGLGAIKEFFGSLFDDLRKIFGLGEENKSKEGGFFDNVRKFFETNEFVQSVKAWIDQAIVDIGNWIQSIPGKIGEFATSIGDFFHGLFWVKDEKTGEETKSSLNNWLTQAIEDIKAFVLDMPNKIQSAIQGVGSFLGNLWNSIFYEEKVDKYGKKTKVAKPLKQWLDQALVDVGEFIKKIPEYVKTGIKGAGNILRTLVSALFGKNDGKDVTGNDIVDTLKKPFEGITFNSVLAKIKSIGTEIINQIVSLFTGSDNWEDNKNTLATSVAAGIEWIKEKAEEAWTNVSAWFVSLPETISKAIQGLFGVGDQAEKPIQEAYDKYGKLVDESFTGEKFDKYGKKIQDEKGPIEQALEDFGKSVGGFIQDIPKTILGFVNTAITEVGKLWDMLWKALRGEGDVEAGLDENGQVIEKQINDAAPDAEKSTSKWEEFTTSLGETISNLFAQLPSFITKGIDSAVVLINKALSGLDELLKADHAEQEAKKAGEQVVETAAEGTEDADASALQEALTALGGDLKKLITETIPTFISDGWTSVKDHAKEWWEIVNGWFDDYDLTDLEARASEIGTKIAGFIESIPGHIRTGVATIKGIFEKKSPMEEAQQQIIDSFTDENGNIVDPKGLEASLKDMEEHFAAMGEKEGGSIWDTIKEIGSSIGDAFVDLGPDILDGLNRAFQWIGDQLTNFTQKLAEKPDDQPFFEWLTGLIGGEDGETSALAEAVNNIGETVKNLITNIIPKFLGEAFAEIATGVPRFFSSLFGGGNAEGKEAGEEYGDTVAEGMAEGFATAFKEKSPEGMDLSWLNPLNWFIGSASAEDSETAVEGAVNALEQFNGALDQAEEAVEKKENLVNRQEAIQKLEDDYLKAQLETNKAYYSHGGESDEFKNAKQKEKDIKAQIDVLDSLEDEYVDLEALFGTSGEVKGEKTKEAVTGFLGLFSGLLDGLGQFAGSDLAMYAVIAVAIATIIHSLKETLSITDEFESIGWTAKWEAIKFAIMGIVAMLGWISYLSTAAANDPNDQRLDKTMETLDKMVAFIERIGTVLTVVSALGKGVADIFSGKNATGGSTGNWFTNLLGGVLGKLADIGLFTISTDAISGSLESLFDSITTIFDDLGQGVESFVSFIDPAISGLAQMADKLDQAITAVGKIADLMAAFYDMIGIVGISVAETDEGTKSFMAAAEMFENDQPRSAAFLADELERRMTFMFQLSTMMKNLAEGLKSFEEIEDAQAQVQKALEVVQSGDFVQFVRHAVNVIYGALTATFGGSMVNLDSAAIGFEMLANAFSVFSEGINGLNLEEVTAFEQALKVLDGLAATLEEASGNSSNWHKILFGDNSLSKYGKEIKMFGGYIKGFFTSINELAGTTTGEEDLNLTQRRIEMVLQIAEGMGKAANLLGTFGGVESLEYIGPKLEGFGSNIGAFIRQVNTNMGEGIDLEKVQIIATGVQSLAELMKGIGAMGNLYPEDIGGLFSAFMQAIAENLASGENDLYNIGHQAGMQLDAGLAEGINTGIAISAAQQLADAIEAAINDQDIHPKITPVIEIDEDTIATLKLFDQNGTGTFHFDTTGMNDNAQGANPNLYGGAPDYSEILASIQSTLSGFNSGQVTVETSLEGVSVQMDTGAIVGALIGEIDQRLGRLGFYSEREG